LQTDPNWGNFLYDEETDRIYLIDFGAARDFPKDFVDNYLEMVGDFKTPIASRPSSTVVVLNFQFGFSLRSEDLCVLLTGPREQRWASWEPFLKRLLSSF
jgi:predicted unusual protein kinase regulating ubiquinone biosynthesis (AarF/ABC1/UbiB family)